MIQQVVTGIAQYHQESRNMIGRMSGISKSGGVWIGATGPPDLWIHRPIFLPGSCCSASLRACIHGSQQFP